MSWDLIRARVPSFQCPFCGSTCFREQHFVEIPTYSPVDALECQVRCPVNVLVCLCGHPVPPYPPDSWYARLPSPTGRFLHSLNRGEKCAKTLVPLASLQLIVERAQLPVLQERVRQLESAVEKMRAKQKLAARRGAARGRDWLVQELQNQGLTYREARAAVQAMVEVMCQGLRRDKLLVTPLGRFELRQRNPYKHGRHPCIVFTQEPGLLEGKTTDEKGPDATGPR